MVVLPLPVGPGDEDDAVGPLDQLIHQRGSRAARSRARSRSSRTFVLCSRRITMRSWSRLVGMVETRTSMLRPAILQRDAAVLRQALLGDVEAGHDLHARDHGAHELPARAPRDGRRHRRHVSFWPCDPKSLPYLSKSCRLLAISLQPETYGLHRPAYHLNLTPRRRSAENFHFRALSGLCATA